MSLGVYFSNKKKWCTLIRDSGQFHKGYVYTAKHSSGMRMELLFAILGF